MATILRLGYQTALEQFKIADSTKTDGLENLSHVMRGDQISLLARKVVLADSKDPWATLIRALLIEQAKKLPPLRIGREEMSVMDYWVNVQLLAENAENGTAKEIFEHLKSLKEAKVYPRNEKEIDLFIEAQKQLRALSSVFNFCRDVEALYNPAPTINGDEVILAKPKQGEIARLRNQFNELDKGKKYQALEMAKLQMIEMEAASKESLDISRNCAPKEEARPIEEAQPKEVERPKEETVPQCRMWTWLAATAVLAVALGVLSANRFQ